MTILLLHDIPGLGRKFQLVEVDKDTALQTFLPQRRALVATPIVRKRYAECIQRALHAS